MKLSPVLQLCTPRNLLFGITGTASCSPVHAGSWSFTVTKTVVIIITVIYHQFEAKAHDRENWSINRLLFKRITSLSYLLHPPALKKFQHSTTLSYFLITTNYYNLWYIHGSYGISHQLPRKSTVIGSVRKGSPILSLNLTFLYSRPGFCTLSNFVKYRDSEVYSLLSSTRRRFILFKRINIEENDRHRGSQKLRREL